MKRREFVTLVGVTVASLRPSHGVAQAPPKQPLIGVLTPSPKAASERFYSGFSQGMRELGYLEGRDYAIEARYADGDFARLPRLAEELVRLRPDVIVAGTSPAALAAKQATSSIPIVGLNLNDPVGMGLVASEARPGSNVTGTLLRVEGQIGKQLEIALDVKPGVTRIGMLVNPANPIVGLRREIEAAAAKLAVSLAPVLEARTADDIGPAFQTFAQERAGIVVVFPDPLILAARRQVAAFALASRVPTVHSFREHVEAGGLISYGVDLRANFQRGAYYVVRILKGDKPAELPIEFLTKVELVINLTTAKAIGLVIPPTLLARADEVIE